MLEEKSHPLDGSLFGCDRVQTIQRRERNPWKNERKNEKNPWVDTSPPTRRMQKKPIGSIGWGERKRNAKRGAKKGLGDVPS